jgi:hypothetical protein
MAKATGAPNRAAATPTPTAKVPPNRAAATPTAKATGAPNRAAATPTPTAKVPPNRAAATPTAATAKATGAPNRAVGQPAKPAAADRQPNYYRPTGPARQRLHDALAWVEDFVVECGRLAGDDGPPPWPPADTPELVGLERWGTDLAKTDRVAGVCALVLAAQHGLPKVLEAGGDELDSMGYRGDEVLDGASVESQLDRCAHWIDDPSEPHRQRVEDGFDPTRQLHTWDPDLIPGDAKSFFWYYELGQLASASIVKSDGDPASTSYYYWPPEVSVGRGLVVAARGLRREGTAITDIIRDIYAALIA